MTSGIWAGLPDRLAALSLMSRRVLLFFLGGLTTLGLPPVNAWPIAFVTLPVLVWCLEAAPTRRAAFGTGWWFAFGYLVIGWYWISNALLVFSESFWWMIPFALIGLPGAMAVYYGLALTAVNILTGAGFQHRTARVLLAAAALAGADLARGYLLTGFPWNSFGYLWSGTEELSQTAAWIGTYGMGVLVLLSGALPALLPERRFAWRAVAVALVIPAVLYGLGAARLATAPDLTLQQTDSDRPGLRIVQSNIPQREKWRPDLRERNFATHLADSGAGRPDWVQAVLWPETAAAFPIAEAPIHRARAAAFAVPEEGYLITGTLRRLRDPLAIFNSIAVLDPAGDVAVSYDKSHLVPFGEYVPLGGLLPIDKVTAGKVNFSPGPGPRTISLPGLPPFSPLVCYETIFPGGVTDSGNRPEWLLNVTNDAWYRRSAGPYQHLQHARMRAIEEGLPLVRPANTGVSIAFDGYGRELGRISLESRGVLDVRLPPPLPDTVFVRYGNMWLVALMLILLVLGLAARWWSPSAFAE